MTATFKVPERTFIVRPGGDLEGAEFVMTDMSLDEVAAFEEQRLTPGQLRDLFVSHVVRHNLDREPSEVGISFIADIWRAWIAAIKDGALPPATAVS